MKFLEIVIISCLAVSFLLPLVMGEIDRYRMALEEKETKFSEEIDVDGRKNVAVFRVPAHNNVNGADFYNDFNMRVTVTRILSKQVCYISEMDPSLLSPGKLKEDLDRVASQPSQLPVEEISQVAIVTGPSDRGLLTMEILDFCGVLPIYNRELYTSVFDSSNGSTIIRTRRQKRQVQKVLTKKIKSCVTGGDMTRVQNCMNAKYWDLNCKMQPHLHACYYFVTCTAIKPSPGRSYNWSCTEVHKASDNVACCDYICAI